MNWQNSIQRFLPHRKSRLSQEAGSAMFQGLRVRLTLWYCGVLGFALILFGVSLYLGARYFLLSPIQSDAAMHARGHTQEWLGGAFDRACPSTNFRGQFGPPVPQPFFMSELAYCFDQNGSLLPNQSTTGVPSEFFTSTIVQQALQTGLPTTDTVNTSTGPIYRYALAVPNPSGNGYMGVVLIGESIKAQVGALSLLLTLVLSIGSIALLGAGVGGLFLSNRALAPARLAWTNQQRFIADAAHELRTPLTLLRADAEVLLRGRKQLAEEDAALLEDIVAESNHMSHIATNLLTLARLDNHTAHYEHDVVSLAESARAGIKRVQALAEQREITLHLEPDEDTWVIGDPLLLEQAILILLDNAIKYNHSGGHVTIRTKADAEKAMLEVQDTGIGIDAEHLPHLGERFYRVDKARSREAGGTGLGLSIARTIALTHHGMLNLTSVPNQGTTVTLTLPLAHQAIPSPKEKSPESVLSSTNNVR